MNSMSQVVRKYFNPPENTRLQEIYYLVDGKREGEHRVYYKNNQQLRILCNYVDDMIEGAYYVFGTDGSIMTHCYFKKGTHNGLFRAYRDNGNLFYECTYRAGVYDGECRMYNESGVYIGSKYYKSGLLC